MTFGSADDKTARDWERWLRDVAVRSARVTQRECVDVRRSSTYSSLVRFSNSSVDTLLQFTYYVFYLLAVCSRRTQHFSYPILVTTPGGSLSPLHAYMSDSLAPLRGSLLLGIWSYRRI